MGKINAIKQFQFDLLAKTKAGKEIQPFIEYVNSVFEELVRNCRGLLTLGENVRGKDVTATLIHGVQTVVDLGKGTIAGITHPLVIDGDSDPDALTSFAFTKNSKGEILLTCQFRKAEALAKRTVSFFVFYK